MEYLLKQKLISAMENIAEVEIGSKVRVMFTKSSSNAKIETKEIFIKENLNSIEELWANFLHELYHLLYTPVFLEKALENAGTHEMKYALNIIEDIRIESKAATMQIAKLFQFSNLQSLQRVIKNIKKSPDRLQTFLFMLIAYGTLAYDMSGLARLSRTESEFEEAKSILIRARNADSKEVPELAKRLMEIIQKVKSRKNNQQAQEELQTQGEENSNLRQKQQIQQMLKKIQSQALRESRKIKQQVSSQVMQTIHSFSEQKKSAATVINRKKETENLNELRLLSEKLAKETIRRIKGLTTEKFLQSYAGEFNPRLYVRHIVVPYWFNRREPSKELRRTKVALLIDTSYSMRGPNEWYAAIAGRVFAYVTEWLRIPYNIIAFSTKAYPIAIPDDIIPMALGSTYPIKAVKQIPDIKNTTVVIITDGEFWKDNFVVPGFEEHLFNSTKFIGINSTPHYSLHFKRQNISIVKKPSVLPEVVSNVIMDIILR